MKTWQQHIEHAEASLAEATKKSSNGAHSQAVGSDVHIAVTHLKVASFLRDGISLSPGVPLSGGGPD